MFLAIAAHQRSTHTNYLIKLLKSCANFRCAETFNYESLVSRCQLFVFSFHLPARHSVRCEAANYTEQSMLVKRCWDKKLKNFFISNQASFALKGGAL